MNSITAQTRINRQAAVCGKKALAVWQSSDFNNTYNIRRRIFDLQPCLAASGIPAFVAWVHNSADIYARILEF